LLKTESCTLKPCVGCCPGSWGPAVRRSLDAIVQPVGRVCQTVLATLFGSMGAWRDVICACMHSCCMGRIWQQVWFWYGDVSTIALNVSITGQTLDRNIEKRGDKNFGGVWLVEGQILRTLKPVCVVLCTRSLRFKFDDPWMPCQTVGCMSMARRALLGSMGA
jgi:hypothetical protein